jgi:hypothetical protein
MIHSVARRILDSPLLLWSLALVFIGATPFMGSAETVPELEAGLKNCQANWDRLNERIKQVCPYEGTTEVLCAQYHTYLEGDKRQWYYIKGLPDNQEIAIKRKECEKAEYDTRMCDSIFRKPDERHYCWGFPENEQKCRQELQAMLRGQILDSKAKQAELARLDAAIDKDMRDYDACLRQLELRNECLHLQGQLKSVVVACDEIKRKLQEAQASAQQAPLPTGTVRVYPTGTVPNEVGRQATFQAHVESDSQATGGTRYAYYWYVNGQYRSRGYDLTTFTFPVQEKGLNRVVVQVMKTSDNGKTWRKVGDATDKLYVEWGAPQSTSPAPPPQSTPAPPAGSSSKYDKYLKPMSCERACETGCSASRDPQCMNQCLIKCK